MVQLFSLIIMLFGPFFFCCVLYIRSVLISCLLIHFEIVSGLIPVDGWHVKVDFRCMTDVI